MNEAGKNILKTFDSKNLELKEIFQQFKIKQPIQSFSGSHNATTKNGSKGKSRSISTDLFQFLLQKFIYIHKHNNYFQKKSYIYREDQEDILNNQLDCKGSSIIGCGDKFNFEMKDLHLQSGSMNPLLQDEEELSKSEQLSCYVVLDQSQQQRLYNIKVIPTFIEQPSLLILIEDLKNKKQNEINEKKQNKQMQYHNLFFSDIQNKIQTQMTYILKNNQKWSQKMCIIIRNQLLSYYQCINSSFKLVTKVETFPLSKIKKYLEEYFPNVQITLEDESLNDEQLTQDFHLLTYVLTCFFTSVEKNNHIAKKQLGQTQNNDALDQYGNQSNPINLLKNSQNKYINFSLNPLNDINSSPQINGFYENILSVPIQINNNTINLAQSIHNHNLQQINGKQNINSINNNNNNNQTPNSSNGHYINLTNNSTHHNLKQNSNNNIIKNQINTELKGQNNNENQIQKINENLIQMKKISSNDSSNTNYINGNFLFQKNVQSEQNIILQEQNGHNQVKPNSQSEQDKCIGSCTNISKNSNQKPTSQERILLNGGKYSAANLNFPTNEDILITTHNKSEFTLALDDQQEINEVFKKANIQENRQIIKCNIKKKKCKLYESLVFTFENYSKLNTNHLLNYTSCNQMNKWIYQQADKITKQYLGPKEIEQSLNELSIELFTNINIILVNNNSLVHMRDTQDYRKSKVQSQKNIKSIQIGSAALSRSIGVIPNMSNKFKFQKSSTMNCDNQLFQSNQSKQNIENNLNRTLDKDNIITNTPQTFRDCNIPLSFRSSHRSKNSLDTDQLEQINSQQIPSLCMFSQSGRYYNGQPQSQISLTKEEREKSANQKGTSPQNININNNPNQDELAFKNFPKFSHFSQNQQKTLKQKFGKYLTNEIQNERIAEISLSGSENMISRHRDSTITVKIEEGPNEGFPDVNIKNFVQNYS